MLLAIDCGNTNTVFAVFDGTSQLGAWRTSTNAGRTADEYAVWLTGLMALNDLDRSSIDAVILATVVPATSFNLKSLCNKYFDIDPMVVGDPALSLGIEVRIDNPREVGADRLVNAVAAHERHAGTAMIMIDFGTATTFDVLGSDGAYEGGVIAPGINLSLDALYQAAAQLPRIAIQPPERPAGVNEPMPVIGKNTVTAMQSGIFWGYVGLIEGLVSRIKAQYGAPMFVVATGGLAPLFAKSTDVIQEVDPDVTLRGLVLIHERNKDV
ncbi:MAG: type III pantothenate kinase [Rhodospirillaceae bacterium]|nr:type III pantothenate kinase [Rhodospirillaceae bacterium]